MASLVCSSLRGHSYVGTLHEISSENSTVALEQVVSFGTEGRRPDDDVPPSNVVYEYIVFRGSDVKDLRIEEAPKESKSSKPQMPDDPAILGVSKAAGANMCHVPLSVKIPVMKIFGCKSYCYHRERKPHVETFRCLPSDVYNRVLQRSIAPVKA